MIITTTTDYIDSAIQILNELKQRVEKNELLDTPKLREEARRIDQACGELNFSDLTFGGE